MSFYKKQRPVYVFFVILGLLIFFQNCGINFKSLTHEQSILASKEPNPYILPTDVTPTIEPAKMDWTFTETNPDFSKAVDGLSSQCETLRVDFETTRQLAPIIYDEGLLPGDPKIAAMTATKSSFDKAMNIAFCAYFAKTDALRKLALTTIAKYIVDWNDTYIGDGNPINERFFIKLFTLADLVFPLLTVSEMNAIRNLADRIDKKEVAFMATLPLNDNRLKNNWHLRHLMIRMHANIILNNSAQIQNLKQKIDQDIINQYTAPAGFVASQCPNLASIGVYGSFDLQQRDAFLYHLSGLAELAPWAVLNPSMLSTAARTKLYLATDLMKPYVLGTKTHREFVCTSAQYDKDKLKLDPSLGTDWNPDSSKVFFRYSRLLWDQTEPWTNRFIHGAYAPWFKVFYTGKGDILNLPP